MFKIISAVLLTYFPLAACRSLLAACRLPLAALCSPLATCRLPLVALLILCSCQSNSESVVVYVSVDQNYAEPVLRRFEEQTGIKTLAVYDIEASKTTGLVNRIIAEKRNPQADVFWSGEFVQTIALEEQHLLAPFRAQNAKLIPEKFKDPEGYWTGFSGRARVFIVNTDKLNPDQYPQSINDLIESPVPADQIGMALPLFGTTYTHAAALYTLWGGSKTQQFFSSIEASGMQILNGNSSVRDWVASGKLAFGLTDTDDALGAIKRGDPVELVFPDQRSIGTMIIPNTVALIRNSKNPLNGQQFIEFLLSNETLEYLIETGWCQVPLRQSSKTIPGLPDQTIRSFELPLDSVYSGFETYRDSLRKLFVK